MVGVAPREDRRGRVATKTMAAADDEGRVGSGRRRRPPPPPSRQLSAERSFEKSPSPCGAVAQVLAARLGQRGQELPLVLVEVGRRVHLHVDEEVAPAAAPELGHAQSLQRR